MHLSVNVGVCEWVRGCVCGETRPGINPFILPWHWGKRERGWGINNREREEKEAFSVPLCVVEVWEKGAQREREREREGKSGAAESPPPVRGKKDWRAVQG